MTTYWAELDTNNIVKQVITGVDDATIDGIPTGDWYSNFIGSPCVQTFIDNPEKTYAGVGSTWNGTDFVAPYFPPTPTPPDE